MFLWALSECKWCSKGFSQLFVLRSNNSIIDYQCYDTGGLRVGFMGSLQYESCQQCARVTSSVPVGQSLIGQQSPRPRFADSSKNVSTGMPHPRRG